MAPSVIVRSAVKVIAILITEQLIEKKKKKQRVWIKDWIKRRNVLGASARLLKEIAIEDPESYKNFMRLSPSKFEELLTLVAPKVTKSKTFMRTPVSPRLKLEVTLRYIASGDSLASLQYLYRLPRCTISAFLPDVLLAIYEVLGNFIKVRRNIFYYCIKSFIWKLLYFS